MRDPLAVSRRELVGAIARWSVPTVVSITLGAKVLEAKASCPPCQRKQGATCRACSVSNVLNCNCEPCLGPPYCSAVGSLREDPGASVAAPGSQGLRSPGSAKAPSVQDSRLNTYLRLQRERATQQDDPFTRPLYRDPFSVDNSPYGRPRTGNQQTPGLYERLRADSLSRRRP